MASDSDAKERARLMTHFHGVLETLNTNIYRYREAKAAEFTALCVDQLADIPEPLATEVRKAIQESISKFPELNGFTIDPACPIKTKGKQQADSPASSGLEPSPVIHRDDRDRGEHGSDLEGCFIPDYLPLLDASKTQATPPLSDITPDQQRTLPLPQEDPQQEHHQDQPVPEPATPQGGTTSPPDSTRRRSALRRSSSATKSPRKVRFDIGRGDDSDSGGNEGGVQTEGNQHPTSSPGPSSPSKFPPSILDDPDEAPPPKKVSSVERLRLLGRRPYRTQEESDADAPAIPIDMDSTVRSGVDSAQPRTSARPMSGIGRLHRNPRPQLELDAGASTSDTDDGREVEINIRKFKKMKPLSSAQTSPTEPATASKPLADAAAQPEVPGAAQKGKEGESISSKAPSSSSSPQQGESKANKTEDGDDEEGDPIFKFDEENLPPKLPSHPETPDDESQEEHDGGGKEEMAEEAEEAALASSTKPAVPMTESTQSTRSQVPAPFLDEGIGSYKGHVLKMPVVKDPNVYAQAVSLGEFNTFVGGIDGTSGMDEGDLNSFRASVAPLPTGSPRSFSERLLMEDARSARVGQQQHNFGSLPVRPARR